MKRNVTILDVSRLAGCSKGVVSAVVNKAKGNIAVSEQTRQRVLAAAAELGYRPNFASRSLARRSTRTIGVYVPPDTGASLGYSYEGRILKGVEEACRAHTYDLLVLNIGGGVTPDQCQDRFTEGRIDGLLLLHVRHDAPWVEALIEGKRNVMAVNYYGTAPLRSATFDDAAATRLAVEHLVQLGHKRIAYLGSVEHDLGPGGQRRCQGYQLAMRAAGLTPRPEWIWDHANPLFETSARVDWSTEDVPRAIDYLLGLGDARPTAIACHGDMHAVAAMQQLMERGLSIPGEMSLVGIDDSELAPKVFPALTSVRQPLEDMGRWAAEQLIAPDRDEGETGDAPVLWSPMLKPRQSSAPPQDG